jgi:hypothetical protein
MLLVYETLMRQEKRSQPKDTLSNKHTHKYTHNMCASERLPRTLATSVCALELLVHEALSYCCMRP